MIPENIISWDNTRSDCLPFADFQEENDIVLAVVDHLIGDLAEQFCHAVIGIVITSDGVDHLDPIDQSRKLFDDSDGIITIEGIVQSIFENCQKYLALFRL